GLIDLWRARGDGSGPPLRSHFDPFTLRPWLGHVSIAEAVDGGEDFVTRLDGSEIVRLTGDDWTGLRASEIDARYGIRYRAILRDACGSDEPTVNRFVTSVQKDTVSFQRVLLPVREERREVRQLIIGIYPVSRAAAPGWF
ncbi:MAG TPA: PAS domain-containing protein, partial [Alphaproteobacteria bacterium]|nr:PAS domain-containing protein [Alphaproteobacteria bacterium]